MGTTAMRAAVLVASLAIATLVGCSNGDDDAGSTAADTTTTTGSTTTTAAPLPEDRPIDVHVPPGYRDGTPAPLLVVLHGYGVNGVAQEAYLRLRPVTDDEGMLLVAPDGTENADGERFWNATDACCGPASDVDDVAYLSSVIATVSADYDVDPKRIYLVGHSNGGFMSFRMACDRADTVAAIAAIAAATYADPADCAPSEPVATLQVHGTADDRIDYDGGDISGRPYPGAMETLEMWAGYNGCAPTPDEPAPDDREVVVDLPPATVTAFSACDPGGHAELWTAPDAPHIPAFTDTFARQLVDFLLDHPKP